MTPWRLGSRLGVGLGPVLLLGCGSPTLGDGDGDGDGSTGEAESSEGSSAADETTAEPTTTGEGLDESSGGEPEGPRCGDGIIDPGEQCDGPGLPCSADCQLLCGLGPGIELQTSDPAQLYFEEPPLPVADGTGDYIVPTLRGGSRVGPSGEQQWVQTSWSGEWTMTLVQRDPGEFWRASQDDETSFISRHEMGSGDELETIELVPGAAGPSYAMTLDFAPDGDVLLLYVSDTEPMTRAVVVQRRSPDGATVEWSTTLPSEPNPRTGYRLDSGGELSVSADGVIWVLGSDYLDYNTSEPFVATLGPDGDLRWKRIVMEGDIHANGSVRDAALLEGGHAVLTPFRGYRSGSSLGVLFDLESQIMRVDAEGEEIWTVDPGTWVDQGDVHIRDLWILADDRLAFAGHQRFDDHIIGVTGILDPTDGSLLCSSTVAHPTLEVTLAEQFFTATDGSLMVLTASDDTLPIDTLVIGRWMARFGV